MSPASQFPLGFCWSFPGCPPEEGLARLKEAGFEGIELWPDGLHEWGAERWAQALAASGMRCFQLCPYFNFVHGAEKIQASRVMLHEYLEAAASLSCSRLRVFTGPPWGKGVVGADDATEAQWQAAIDTLQEFCDHAPGMEFCLECHAGSLMEDAPSTLRLIDGVNRPNLTVNLQLPLRHEPWQQSLRALAPYTTHIHIHNWETALGEGPLTFLADGAFPWPPVLQYLQRAGRTVCLSVEHATHNDRHDAWETARRDGTYLHELRRLETT